MSDSICFSSDARNACATSEKHPPVRETYARTSQCAKRAVDAVDVSELISELCADKVTVGAG